MAQDQHEHGLYSGEHPPDAHKHGTMDIAEQERVFAGFIRWSAWTVIFILLILGFLALTQT
jgi:Bacterial aa3 type cytochrome c oxidase subunit IV